MPSVKGKRAARIVFRNSKGKPFLVVAAYGVPAARRFKAGIQPAGDGAGLSSSVTSLKKVGSAICGAGVGITGAAAGFGEAGAGEEKVGFGIF